MAKHVYKTILGIAMVLLPAWSASAQCAPGSWMCASLQIGGTLQVTPYPAPPPPVVIVQPEPPPPVVYVQPAAPPPPSAPPPPPQTFVYQARPAGMPLGLHAHLGGLMSRNVQMGGASAALRLRPTGHVAIDLGLGLYGGQDYLGLDRAEVPLTADVLFFLNPRNQFQVYGLAGAGFSFAHAEGFTNTPSRGFASHDYAYYGGQLGVGLELRIDQTFALNTDIRGFLRQRMDNTDSGPEFVEYDGRGQPTGRATDTSTGALFTVGATIYFR